MPKQIQNNQFLGGSPLMDATPQPNSTNAVMSGGVYSALDNLGTEISEVNSKLDELNYSEFDISKLTLNNTYISSGASFWANKIGDFVFFNFKFKAKVDIATGWTPIVSNMSVSERISIVPVTIFNSTIQSRIPQAVIQNNQLKIISNSTNQIKQNDEIEISGFYAY